jgi:hypothetical protein
MERKNKLKVGSVVYQLRHGTAEVRHKIDFVENAAAFSGELVFHALYDGVEILPVSRNFWTKSAFGITYMVARLDTVDRLEKEICLRYIRNADFSKLSLRDAQEFSNLLRNLISGK